MRIRNRRSGTEFSVNGNLDIDNRMFGAWANDVRSWVARVIDDDIEDLWIEVEGVWHQLEDAWDDVDMVGRHIFKKDTTPEAGAYKVMFFF